MEQDIQVNIIGAGLSGLSCALTLARSGRRCRLISVQPSERAQSVLAEGGINGAINTRGEDDSPAEHERDTLKGGVFLGNPEAVHGLTAAAPGIIREMQALGVPFHQENGDICPRYFGGQKKARTSYVKSGTGKMLMSALIAEVRKFEAAGLVTRLPHHAYIRLRRSEDGAVAGVRVQDRYTGQLLDFRGPVCLCSGGPAGLFPGMTTGTTANNGDVDAQVFAEGVEFGNLEMVQYHPTTMGIAGKRCLVSEAARGEGGRLFVERAGERWYFMEEKYPVLKNLMPRDVVSREEFAVVRRPDCGDKVYLDMHHLPEKTWRVGLPDLRAQIIHYTKLDPKTEPIWIEPGIHYFMGGIYVDVAHRTNLQGLYAAGEACMQYHGANRLGGNSTLGAIYGGRVAAQTVLGTEAGNCEWVPLPADEPLLAEPSPAGVVALGAILKEGMGLVRSAETLAQAKRQIGELLTHAACERERNRLRLALAFVLSAENRKESRGSHTRTDYPETREEYRKVSVACWRQGEIRLELRTI